MQIINETEKTISGGHKYKMVFLTPDLKVDTEFTSESFAKTDDVTDALNVLRSDLGDKEFSFCQRVGNIFFLGTGEDKQNTDRGVTAEKIDKAIVKFKRAYKNVSGVRKVTVSDRILHSNKIDSIEDVFRDVLGDTGLLISFVGW